MTKQQTIDWSFFSMARYLLTADPADGSVISCSAAGLKTSVLTPRPGRTLVRLDEPLRQVTRLQLS